MKEIEKVEKTLPTLKKQSATYKLIVPSEVEEKIRYMLRKFPSTEWSGVLFYTHEGGFETNDLVITCKDVFPMDLGNSTYTDFYMSEDVTAYIADNLELFDCDLGLIHSHHTMSAFFSGTDTQTLKEEGNERNCFVSLIVNNAGQYCAAITRKVQSTSEVTVVQKGLSYEFFGNGKIEPEDSIDTSYTKTVNTEVIEYFDLEVERHEVSNSLAYIDDRFDEIKKKKDEAKRVPTTSYYPMHNYHKDYSWINSSNFGNDYDWDWEDLGNWGTKSSLSSKPKVEEPTLWDNKTMQELKVKDDEFVPDDNLVYQAICKMITCTLNLNTEKFNLKQWVTRYMSNVYKRLFEKECDKMYGPFDVWKDFITEYTLNTFDYSKVPESMDTYTAEAYVAEAIIDKLSEYDDNKYIKEYIMAFEDYLMAQ